LVLGACTTQANHLGNPLTWPATLVASTVSNGIYQQRRGQVELLVKSNHPALLDQIAAGTGPILAQAFDTAGVPEPDRPARIIQLQSDLGLYAANPEALIVALMVYGS
jgi:hypothetical protein